MCSHETIAWKVINNSVTDRMIDNSLIHKFRPLRKLRRTKALNSEVKKHCGMKDYKHYVELKTNVLRNLANDTDTSDSSSLSDVDYTIIYSSPSKQVEYVAENCERYIFTSEEDCKGCKRKNIKRQTKSRSNSTERRIRKSPQISKSMSKKCIDVSWQKVKSSNISCLSEQVCTNILDNEENILKNNDCNNFKAQSVSPQFDFRNSTTSRIIKYGNECMRQNHGGSNTIDNKLSSENSTSNKTKHVSEKKVQNHKNQSATMNESNTKFNSHDSHYQSSLSRSTSLENSNDFEIKSNTLKGNDDTVTPISNASSNTKNNDNTYVSRKPEVLKNVRRNLILALERIDSTNNDKDIETDKNVEDSLNCDLLLPSTVSFNRHSTPLQKTCTDIPKIKDLPPDTASLDQQKDSGIDEDSRDRFVKIKGSNKIATNRNTKENVDKILTSSPKLKNNDTVIETAKNCKENEKDAHLKFSKDILRDKVSKEEKKFSGGKKINSSQLNQVDINVEMNQENKEDKHLTKTEDTNDIQNDILKLLSPKQDCMKDAHSEPCNHILEEEDNRKVKKSFEEKEISLQEESLQLNEVDKTQISSINHEGEDKRQANEEKEGKNFPQLNEADKDAKTHFINQEDKICMKLENTHDVQKQQILPKVMNTKILNKRYKIINKKDNVVKNNIDITDNISNNTDITNECTPVKKNTLIHCPDIIDHTDNWQKATVNAEEIDASVALETDNEEINMNYVSPQIKKRLQQQARLNLVVSSDSNESDNEVNLVVSSNSNESDDEYVTTKTSQKHIDGSGTNCSNEDTLKNNETNCASKQTDISHDKETISVPAEVVKIDDLRNIKERIKEKTESLTSCTYENNDLFLSTTNENLIKENINVYKSEHDQSAQASTKSYSNTRLNTSCQYRPYSLQELIENQELLVKTMPTSFTLADLSEDDEAFILNVPSKVVQHNLQGQVLKLKDKFLKFNKSKYRIVHKEMGTTSCIFATGKKRKPYKLINIKKICAITIREKLSGDSRTMDVSNSYGTISSVSKINNQLTDEANSKILKVLNRKKRKRGESSDMMRIASQ